MIAYVPVGLTPETVHPTHLELLCPDLRRTFSPGEVPEGALLLLEPRGLTCEEALSWLKARGWWRELPDMVSAGATVVALGGAMHLLAEGSEEAPRHSGLGLLPGLARRLGPRVRVPHLGWSPVAPRRPHPGLPDLVQPWLYFAHSHALEVDTATLWEAHHGRAFAVASARGRVLGLQADLAASGPTGQAILAHLARWATQA